MYVYSPLLSFYSDYNLDIIPNIVAAIVDWTGIDFFTGGIIFYRLYICIDYIIRGHTQQSHWII